LMSAERSVSPDQESLARELEYHKRRCSELEKRVSKLGSENKELREKLASLETTVSAVVARSIGAKEDTGRRRFKKSGRREGHVGASRSRPQHIDSLYRRARPVHLP
jgi:predicted RNase H-like nuclease (RuvC/YqgF family)